MPKYAAVMKICKRCGGEFPSPPHHGYQVCNVCRFERELNNHERSLERKKRDYRAGAKLRWGRV